MLVNLMMWHIVTIGSSDCKRITKHSRHFIKVARIKLKKNGNDDLRNELLEDIKIDPNVTFDFDKYSQTNMLTDKLVFSRILSYLNITFSKLLSWIEKYYSKSLVKEPKTFDAKLQQRTINTIKNYVNDYISHSKLTSYYSIEDMIQLIRYIMDRNIKYNIFPEKENE